MERHYFLKTIGFTSAGIVTGLIKPFELIADNSVKLNDINDNVIDLTIDKNDELIWGWLLEAVGTSLIGLLVGKIVESFLGNDCLCNGSSCKKNNADISDYSNTKGYYGYESHKNQKFATQHIKDKNTSFENASVAFVNKKNVKITNVEGPFLAGLCAAAKEINQKHGTMLARNIIVPTYEISNGGYKFNENPCYATEFGSNYGKTKITYQPNGNTGIVKVEARDNVDKLGYSQRFKVNAA